MTKYTNNYSIRYTEELNQPLVEQKKGKTMLDKFSGAETLYLMNSLMVVLSGKNKHANVAGAAYLQSSELNKVFGDNYKERLKGLITCVDENYKPSKAVIKDGYTKAYIFTTEAKEAILAAPAHSAFIEKKGLEFYTEHVNVAAIERLIKNDNFEKEEHKQALIIFRACVSSDGRNLVFYRRSKKKNADGKGKGRRFAASPSLQGLKSSIRFKILGKKTTDIDFENCHPTLALAFAKVAGLKNDAMSDYIQNREQRLSEIMEHYQVTRKAAKQLFLQVTYGSALEGNKGKAFPAWKKEYGANMSVSVPRFLMEFREETQAMAKYVLARKDAEWLDSNARNFASRGIALYLQDIEDTLLSKCEGHMKYLKKEIQTLMFDGLMISGTIDDADLRDLEMIINDTLFFEWNVKVDMKLTAKIYEGAE